MHAARFAPPFATIAASKPPPSCPEAVVRKPGAKPCLAPGLVLFGLHDVNQSLLILEESAMI